MRRAAGWWALAVALAVLGLGLRLARGVTLESGLRSLLPMAERDPVLEDLNRASSQQAGRTLLLLVSHAEQARAVRAARSLQDDLRASGAFASVLAGLDEAMQRAVHDLYFPHRYHMLAPSVRAALAGPDAAHTLVEWASARLYGPESSLVARLLPEDPLLLFPTLVRELGARLDDVRIIDGVPVVASGAGTGALVVADVAGDPFDEAVQAPALAAIEAARQRLLAGEPTTTLEFTGLLRFAAAARERIARETTLIGSASFVGTLLFLVLVFGVSRALLLGLLATVVGFVCGLAITLWVFPTFHSVMLVFGVSLAGVSADYALHLAGAHRVAGATWDPRAGLRHVLPAITLGALTSVMAYAALALTPFPALRQVALVSSAGLAGSWATVVFWGPLILDSPSRHRRAPLFHGLAGWILTFWETPAWRAGVPAVGALLILGALSTLPFLRFDDDVRRLQNAPPYLLVEDERVRGLVGGPDAGRFVVVEAPTVEEMLQRQEAVAARLEELARADRLRSFRDLSGFLPSQLRQQDDHALLVLALADPDAHWAIAFDDLAVAGVTAEDLRHQVAAGADGPLTPEDWLASDASRLARHLWLGESASGTASLVKLEGVALLPEVVGALSGLPGVRVVDRASDVSALFGRYRLHALAYVGGAYVLILLLLLVRYGIMGGIRVILPPLVASLLALAVVDLVSGPLHVMHCLATVLVLGLGVDYAIFFAESGPGRVTTYFALILSTLTTVLSFGLLTLSSNPAVASIGAVTFLGTLLCLLFAPAAGGAVPRARHARPSVG